MTVSAVLYNVIAAIWCLLLGHLVFATISHPSTVTTEQTSAP